MPIAKIIGKREFYGIDYYTNEYTLDPRPETELIVDLVLEHFPTKDDNLKILDLGCGTGCIGLTLLAIYHKATGHFVDIDTNAITVAQSNSQKHGLNNRCTFLQSNWFSNVDDQYDIIVTNPPYVATSYALDKNTIHDPHIALFAGLDGLDAYRCIMKTAHHFLEKNGMLFVEIGQGQKDNVVHLAHKLSFVHCEKDLANIDRVIVFRKDD